MSDLIQLCRNVEKGTPSQPTGDVAINWMPGYMQEVALHFYAHAVGICSQGGFSVDKIRVEFASWGIEVPQDNKRETSRQMATELFFDGARWVAERRLRSRRQASDPDKNVTTIGSVYCLLDSIPEPRFQVEKKKGQELYTLRLGRWRNDGGKTKLSIIDPYDPNPNELWQVRWFRQIKAAQSQKELAILLRLGLQRTLSNKERIQMYEWIRNHESFQSFDASFRFMITETIEAYRETRSFTFYDPELWRFYDEVGSVD